MERIRIKLCGMLIPDDIRVVNELMPDYIGFVFAKGRTRTRSLEEALSMSGILNKDIISVGVFKDNPIEEVIEIAKSGVISMIQLHGREDEDYIKELRSKLNIDLIKAFGISGPDDIEAANESSADYVLLDTPGGGTGKSFDHSLLSSMKRPYFLAGGLTPENVEEIVGKYRPFAVDVSSGIETEGKKDPEKMRRFTANVNNL